jgi:hypothetical protein
VNIIRPSGEKALTIEDAAVLLKKAREEYEAVDTEKRAIDRRHTTAVNALSAAQKAFDASVADIRADAPRNTGWHNQRNPGEVA